MMKVSEREFAEFLLKQMPAYDQEIIKQIKPQDCWVRDIPMWFKIREVVRKIVEGSAFYPTTYREKKVKVTYSCENAWERFNEVYPDLKSQWP